ncbi:hypothetical protein [Marinicella sp. W31]|uniref:hypothetical protein n=1 Tax=Marinicella sp. W31 TaxID=3023713 RepID=UPI003756A39B
MSDLMKKISALRRKNLLLLRKKSEEEFFADTRNKDVKYYSDAMFCRTAGIDKNVFSQIKNPESNKVVTENFVRNIEEKMSLPMFWFDIDYDNTNFEFIQLPAELILKALNSYREFLENSSVIIKDDETQQEVLKKLILHLNVNRKVSTDDFFEFLKS